MDGSVREAFMHLHMIDALSSCGFKLAQTTFWHPAIGKEVRARLSKDFRWSRGLQALTLLLLRSASWSRRDRSEGAIHDPLPALAGRRPSAASVLNDVITQRTRHHWLGQILGDKETILFLVDRENPDFRPQENRPVTLVLVQEELPPRNIRIYLGPRDITHNVEQLTTMADAIESSLGARGHKRRRRSVRKKETGQ